MGAVQLAGRRAALTIAWAPRERRDRSRFTTVARERAVRANPATVTDMPVDTKQRASVAGKASAAAKTPDQRAASAAQAARASHGPLGQVKRLITAWVKADAETRTAQLPEIRKLLREAGIIPQR